MLKYNQKLLIEFQISKNINCLVCPKIDRRNLLITYINYFHCLETILCLFTQNNETNLLYKSIFDK